MDVSRFEAIAYAQASKGVLFVKACFIDRFENQPGARLNARAYTYKVPKGLEVKKGDIAIAQVLEKEFGIVEIVEVFSEPPAPDEYDYSKPMKWIFGKVDKELSEALTESDKAVLKALSRAALSSRVAELSKAVGVDLNTVQVPLVSVEPS